MERSHSVHEKWMLMPHRVLGAFYATWIFPTITRLVQVIIGSDTPFWLICLTACFVPIQGALNCVVYIRPRYKQYWVTRRMARCCKRRRDTNTNEETIRRSSYLPGKFSALFYSTSHAESKPRTSDLPEIEEEQCENENGNAGANAGGA